MKTSISACGVARQNGPKWAPSFEGFARNLSKDSESRQRPQAWGTAKKRCGMLVRSPRRCDFFESGAINDRCEMDDRCSEWDCFL